MASASASASMPASLLHVSEREFRAQFTDIYREKESTVPMPLP